MQELTKKARRFLKSQAQRLDPVVMIGKEGLSQDVERKTIFELDTHELIKIKILDAEIAPIKETAQLLADKCSAVVVTTIGKKIVLFAENLENESADIVSCSVSFNRKKFHKLNSAK